MTSDEDETNLASARNGSEGEGGSGVTLTSQPSGASACIPSCEPSIGLYKLRELKRWSMRKP